MFRDRDKWRVRWRENETLRTKTFDSKNEAALFEAQLKTGISTVATLEQSSLKFSDYTKRWVTDYGKIEKSESTWENDQTAIDRHLNPVLGQIRLIDLKKVHGVTLKTEIAKKGVKPKTVNNILQLAKKILATAVDYDLIPANPFQGVKPLKVPKPKFRFWTEADRDRFLKRAYELNPEFADLVLVAIHTGMRKGELQALTKGDLDFDNGLIQVGATYNLRLKKKLDRSKNGEVGFVPMNQEVLRVLSTRKLMKPNQPVFRPGLFQNARRDLQALCDKASVPLITVHDLRHSFASQLAMAGVDLMRIQKLMRHKSIAMTQRYAHLHPDSLQGVTEILSPRNVRGPLKNTQLNSVSS